MNREQVANKVLKRSLIGNIALSILKLLAGIIANSHAIIADAVHSISDVLTTIIAIIGVKWSSKPADDDHHYGHVRIEAVASKLVALILVLTSVFLMIDSYKSFNDKTNIVPGILAIYAAILSIVTKEIMFQYVYRTGKKINSLALISDAWHNRSDALSSVGALIGVVLAKYFNFLWADSLAGIIVSALVFKVGVEIYLKALKQLVDTAPSPEILKELRLICTSTIGVFELSNLKARIVGSYLHLDIEVSVDPDITVREGHDIAERVEENIIKNFRDAKEIMVHINPYQKKIITEINIE